MPASSPKDNAGVVAPAPAIYGAALVLGLAAEFTLPTVPLPRPVSLWLGVVIIALSIPIVISAFKALARAKTAFDARKPTSALVSDRAFHYSRNPTYLSLTLLYAGIALVLGSPWVLLMVVPAVALTQWGVVLREERYLETKFGDEYRRYKTKVRRWL
ncbi:MAG: isoprenylcysteine carboxylmethyltransferase family protein [Polaromonas sp.]|uniref:methyltransferase family protein n=1 Tax=Polaromonas sp. TaxID=1869339 RepID=UPI002736B3FD|nr:isoprenylcysteine carboxylmethyltransferase family protein [Polaromonas sp.]MDP2817395.1 isoprenylcysteine carboxylmethyltransferase family protein [Polaromonas sp.]